VLLACQRAGGKKKVPVNLPEPKGDARDQAGKALGVSGKSVQKAKAIKNTPMAAQVARFGWHWR
jgi:hypothetical protein